MSKVLNFFNNVSLQSKPALKLKNGKIRAFYNLFQAYRILKSKPSFVSPSPVLLGLELTSRCVLDCIMCFRRHLKKDRIGDMSFSGYKKILSQFDHILKLMLSGLGENFLNPDFIKMIHYAKREKCIPMVWNATNGQVLSRTMARDVIRSGLDWLLISVDSAEAETYEIIRKNASFSRLVESIKFLAEEKRKYNNSLKITFATTIQQININQLEKILLLAKEFNVTSIIFAFVIGSFAAENSDLVSNYTFTLSRKKELLLLARKLGIDLIFWAKRDICFEPWLRPCITWDGYIIPCYLRPVTEDFNFGNIFETSFKRLWNNDKIRQFRSKKNSPHLCEGCPRLWK